MLDGYALEERQLPSASPAVVAAAATVDPLNPPTKVVVLSDVFIHREQRRLASAFSTFIAQYERASQNAAKAVTNGQNPSSVLTGLQLTTSIDSGKLQTQLLDVARSLPAGGQYLYDPPQGPLPAGTTYPDPSSTNFGPDIRYFVPPTMRLETQVQTMVSVLNSATTLEQAISTNTVATIRTFYQGCKAALARYIRGAVSQKLFVAPSITQ
jgi:hypothetical protein